jgi:hypothetical protein
MVSIGDIRTVAIRRDAIRHVAGFCPVATARTCMRVL